MTGPSPGSASSGSAASTTKRVVLCASSSMSRGEDLEAVDLGGERGGDGGERRVVRPRSTMRAEPAVSASGTGFRPSLRSVLRHWPSACVWLSTCFTVLRRGARRGHELVAHAQEVLADDVEIGVRQQVMDVGDAAGDRVLDRDHGVAARRPTSPPRARPRRWRRRRPRRSGKGLAAGEVRVGAGLALVGDAVSPAPAALRRQSAVHR